MEKPITPSQVYVDALPESIVVTEKYDYDIEISANEQKTFTGAQGEAVIEVPYDGNRSLNKAAIEKLLKIPEAQEPDAQGLIGWLAIGSPVGWNSNWQRPALPEILPVKIPLSNQEINADQWGRDQFRAIIKHTYIPLDPQFFPISIKIKILDDLPVKSELQPGDMIKFRFPENHLVGKVVVDFTVQLSIPSIIEIQKVDHIELETLEFKWPTIATKWQAIWYGPDTNELDWFYNPVLGTVTINHIHSKLIMDKDSLGSPFSRYECHLVMVMALPGLFIRSTEKGNDVTTSQPSNDEPTSEQTELFLRGDLKISIKDILLSGREVKWIYPDGIVHRDSPTGPAKKTEITAHFISAINELFTNREIITYRYWNFPGVRLNEVRVADVIAGLDDIGYRYNHLENQSSSNYKEQRGKEEDNSIQQFLLQGKKYVLLENNDSETEIILDIILERANRSHTRRVHSIKGLRLSTGIDSSDLVIQIRGKMSNMGDMLDKDLDKLQIILTKRFANVVDLK
ncbi:MAG: hypothetical protein GYA17_00280 [Chloroflexi bacterium]|nr:hypothetical protein [Chloroflexota bacterium]